ncbi:MAG: hypothetical protein QXG65_04435 [Thermoplasmata archaeon]
MSAARVRSASAPVGVVLAITPNGSITVRAAGSDAVAEGTRVADPRGRFRGRVVRVFGPVSRPYLSVRARRPLSIEEGASLLGRTLVLDAGEGP